MLANGLRGQVKLFKRNLKMSGHEDNEYPNNAAQAAMDSEA